MAQEMGRDFLERALANALGRVGGQIRLVEKAPTVAERADQAGYLVRLAQSVEKLAIVLAEMDAQGLETLPPPGPSQ